jgi:hypothetical protein
MDEPMQATPTADMELEQRLDAYARARLNIAPDAAARIRARVMLEARQTLNGAATAPSLTVVGAPANARTGGRLQARVRRGGALLLAAGLAVGVLGGTAAASTAGGPLYGARVWVEEMTLPTEPTERAAAELRRLESRLAEIQIAAANGDDGAATAALAAYSQIADEALAEAGTDSSSLNRLQVVLGRHLAVLRGIAAMAPSQATEALQRNIDRAVLRNDATLEKIASQTPPPNANQGGGGQGGAGQGGGGQGGANEGRGPGAQPEHSQKPPTTPKPAATPDQTKKPHPTAKPVPTPASPASTPDPTARPGSGNHPPKPSPKSDGTGRSATP